MSEVSHSAEWSALERTITQKLGVGHGVSVLLGLLKKLHDGQAMLEPPVIEIVPGPEPRVEVMESTP